MTRNYIPTTTRCWSATSSRYRQQPCVNCIWENLCGTTITFDNIVKHHGVDDLIEVLKHRVWYNELVHHGQIRAYDDFVQSPFQAA